MVRITGLSTQFTAGALSHQICKQDIVDRKHQELNPTTFHGPDDPLSNVLPPCPAALFFHGHSFDTPGFRFYFADLSLSAPCYDVPWVRFFQLVLVKNNPIHACPEPEPLCQQCQHDAVILFHNQSSAV